MSALVDHHYDGPDLVDRVFSALRAEGRDPQALHLDDLAALDEFHALGRPATVALAELAGIRAGEAVLDVGAGIGGPARVLAERYGARVTALDRTTRFNRLHERLNAATGLAGRIAVVEGDALALPFADASFDVAWTQAVLQNVPDKAALLAELRRVLRPGGRLALFELVAGRGGELHYPLPWADGPEGSFVADAETLRVEAAEAGFAVAVWREGLDVVADVQRVAAGPPAAAGPGLELVMPDHDRRMAAVGRNVAEGRIALLQALLIAG